jgi:hypothetical protein
MDKLPLELFDRVLDYLSLTDMVNLARTCKAFQLVPGCRSPLTQPRFDPIEFIAKYELKALEEVERCQSSNRNSRKNGPRWKRQDMIAAFLEQRCNDVASPCRNV